jgi:adenylate cyclase class 2
MKHEYEAKFLSIDVADLQAKLTALGAVQAFPRTLLTRRHGRDPLAARAP